MYMSHLSKTKKEYENLKKQGIRYTFVKTNQIKLVFNMKWPMKDFKDMPKRTASDKILRDKAFNIAKNPK